jgi:hypothetical protein
MKGSILNILTKMALIALICIATLSGITRSAEAQVPYWHTAGYVGVPPNTTPSGNGKAGLNYNPAYGGLITQFGVNYQDSQMLWYPKNPQGTGEIRSKFDRTMCLNVPKAAVGVRINVYKCESDQGRFDPLQQWNLFNRNKLELGSTYLCVKGETSYLPGLNWEGKYLTLQDCSNANYFSNN